MNIQPEPEKSIIKSFQISSVNESTENVTDNQKKRLDFKYLIAQWWLWCGLLFSLPCAVGIWAVVHIVFIPEISNCADAWNSESEASRLYCAQSVAKEKEADKLIQAIEMVNYISSSHPLHEESQRLKERWSQEVIILAEKKFHDGNLEKAVNILKQIPTNVPSKKVANKRIKEWELIWSKGEEIYQNAEAELEHDSQSKWYLALNKSKELLHLGNEYWADTKYNKLISHIQHEREVEEEELKNKREAEKEAKKEADKAKLALNESTFKPYSTLLTTNTPTNTHKNPPNNTNISNSIPKNTLSHIIHKVDSQWEVDLENRDKVELTKATNLANTGKVEDLNLAIVKAYQISSPRHYKDAQKLIKVWNQQVKVKEDQLILARAKEIAKKDDAISLEIAIAEAGSINSDNPLYKEANSNVKQWSQRKSQIESTEKLSQTLNIKDDFKNLSKTSGNLTTDEYNYIEMNVRR
jgi:hypothetical protein